MPDATRTVRTTLTLEIGGLKHLAGTVLLLPAADAQAMIDQGRARDLAPQEAPETAPERAPEELVHGEPAGPAPAAPVPPAAA